VNVCEIKVSIPSGLLKYGSFPDSSLNNVCLLSAKDEYAAGMNKEGKTIPQSASIFSSTVFLWTN